MKSYYVYILECDDKSYYIGVTNDLNRRIQEYNQGIDSNKEYLSHPSTGSGGQY